MNQREAKRVAHLIAYRFLQQALDGGGTEAQTEYNGTETDQRKIDEALDALTQRHFELGERAADRSQEKAEP